MPQVHGDILQAIPLVVLRLHDHAVDDVAEVAFVFGGGVEFLAGHFGGVGGGVVAGAEELDEFKALFFRQVEVGEVEVDDDFGLGRVGFAHVGSVAEAEGRFFGVGLLEGFGEACFGVS